MTDQNANAERIVACVNAMQGIRNPQAIAGLVEAAWGVIENPDMKAMMRLSEALAALDAEESR